MGDVSLETRLASGAEGQVWLGKFRTETVAIKVLHVLADKDPWDEREISFMMSMKHERIVKFVGAGNIWHSELQEFVLFLVQEFMTGGSLDKRLWHTDPASVTWSERVQWIS